jgi:FolB domain-containing protein
LSNYKLNPHNDKVFINDLLVRGIIGVTERERSQPQDIVINIILFADTDKGGQSDDIHECVNYRTVAKAVIAHTEKIARYTVEALAADIAKICLSFNRVNEVIVRVEKPGAVRFSRSVGVEIRRSKTWNE